MADKNDEFVVPNPLLWAASHLAVDQAYADGAARVLVVAQFPHEVFRFCVSSAPTLAHEDIVNLLVIVIKTLDPDAIEVVHRPNDRDTTAERGDQPKA